MELYISEYIENNRKKKGWTVEEFAEKMDVTTQTYHNWVNGAMPRPSKLKKMEELFGVNFIETLYEVDKPNSSNELIAAYKTIIRKDAQIAELKDQIQELREQLNKK